MTDIVKQESSVTLLPSEIKSKRISDFPERYLIKEVGSERILTCLEAPNLQVRIKAGGSISASSARKSPPGTIFLDGVAQAEPFLDHEKLIYNLDHHEGCIRAFTLATCEQALVMIMKGLDLQDREWKIFANEPDLDTILAIWILLNSRRIVSKAPIHQRILFTLVRLEGIIDSIGLELRELSALAPDQMHKTMRIIDHLRSEEVLLKKEGRWAGADFLEYTVSVLHKIDNTLYKSSEFVDFKGVDELARTELTNSRIAAVVESDQGIYELEPHLNKLYGNRLGWVALRTGNNTYTLRQMDIFMPVSLEDLYPRLNFMDPAVKSRRTGNRWGGSSDIGGSPRGSGTKLTPQEIALACRDVAAKRSWALQARRFAKTAAQVAGIVTIAEVFRHRWHPSEWIENPLLKNWLNQPESVFFLLILLFTCLMLIGYAHRRPWQFGLISPAGRDWLTPLPVGMLCGFIGGVLLLPGADFGKQAVIAYANAFVLVPLALELLFRSLAHGLLAQKSVIQDSQSRWFLSWPNIAAALLYAVFVGFIRLYHAENPMAILKSWTLAQHLLGAIGFALVAGMIRERSQSILTPYFLHVISLAAMLMTHKTL